MIIFWSELAEKSYYANILYLKENWDINVVQQFILKVEKTMALLVQNPGLFKDWDFNNRYKLGKITSHISVFYSLEPDRIEIHLFWDNRQNPQKLKKILEL